MEEFNFNELIKETQTRVIEEWMNEGYALNITSVLTDIFREVLQNYGFDDDVIVEWSLNYCQGDGVAFYGEIDLEKVLHYHLDDFSKDELRRLYWLNNEFGVSIETERNSYGHRYSHAYTMVVSIDCDYRTDYRHTEQYDEVLQKLEEVILNSVRSLSHKLERLGYDFIERVECDEMIRALSEGNDEYYVPITEFDNTKW